MNVRWRLKFYRLASHLRHTTVSHIGDRLAGYAASLQVFPACQLRAALPEPQSAPPSGGAVR